MKKGDTNKFKIINVIIIAFGIISFFSLFIFASVNVNAPAKNIWNSTLDGPQNQDDYGRDIVIDSSGNIYIVGYSHWSSSSNDDIYIGKFDSSGNNLWNSTLDGPQNQYDYGTGIALDSSGNIYITGYSNWSGTQDIYIGKFDSSGNNLWNSTLDGPQNQDDYGSGIVLDSSGSIYVVGSSRWTSNSSSDIYLGKFDSSTGNNIWNKTIDGPFYNSDSAYNLIIDSSGSIYVVGSSRWTSNVTTDIYLGKFDSSGNNLWNSTLNGPQNNSDTGNSIALDSSGSIILVGSSRWTSSTNSDIYIGKFNATTGNNIWNSTLNGPQNSGDIAYDLFLDSSDNIYLSGYSGWYGSAPDFYLGKFNSSGNNIWNYSINGPQNGVDILYAITNGSSDNIIYTTGYSYWSGANYDIYLGKFYDDKTVPNVTFSGITNTINNGNYSGTTVLNVSVVDNLEVGPVYFDVSYPNGTRLSFIQASGSGNYYNATLNTEEYLETFFNITAYVNDTSGNINDSESIQIRVDNTAPSAVFLCSPSSVYIGETINCSCEVSDSESGVDSSLTVFDSSPSTSSTGTYTEICTFADLASNTGSVSVDYTIKSRGGALLGGSSTSNIKISEISPSNPKEIIIINNSYLCLTKIKLESSEIIEDISLQVDKISDSLLSIITSEVGLDGVSYQAFKINAKNLNNSLLKNVTMMFRINKTWVDKQGAPKNIALFRQKEEGSNWSLLETIFLNEDDEFYYYKATSPGFSNFVVFFSIFECVPNEKRCLENLIQVCVGDRAWFVTESCPYGCENAECVHPSIFERIFTGKMKYYTILISAIAIIFIGISYILFGKRKKPSIK